YSEYDILGRRIKLSSNLGADISFELDKLSNISHIHATTTPSLEGQDSWEAKIDYDELGLEIYRQLTGGVKHETRRDRLGRMRHQVTKDGQGANIYWKEYQWGIDYRLYNIIDHTYKDRDVAFDYDDKGYLVRAIYAKKEEQFRTPDKLGNLYETKDKKDRKYKNSQLQEDRTYYYHYDVEGNLIFKEYIKDVGYRPVFSGGELRDRGINPKSTSKGFLYTWNANGSLRSVTDLKGVTYRFRYDAFGRRLEKRRMASTFRFVWDGNVLLHETFKKDNSENTELTTWVFEGFVPTAKLVNGKAYSIISDHLGTPILAIDSEGNEVWNRQLDIYGRVKREIKASSLGDDVRPFIPFLYQGQYYDFETKLAYNRYRYYSPESGMYISQDPIKLNGNNPNLYAYVGDNNWQLDVFGLDVYYLLAAEDGWYPVFERGKVQPTSYVKLNQNDLYKIGETQDIKTRYSQKKLMTEGIINRSNAGAFKGKDANGNPIPIGLNPVIISTGGTKAQDLVTEKKELQDYMDNNNGELPAGNKVCK
ncbi:MAG: RHS repeat-associated core domain-containing protein, partial [Capnocytophaga sp.]|nr:RHS repeat-associated core domain-containing protein [Capnocytophaga sp.]